MYNATFKLDKDKLENLVCRVIESFHVTKRQVIIQTECGYELVLKVENIFGAFARFKASKTVSDLIGKRINGVDYEENYIDFSWGDYSESAAVFIEGVKEIKSVNFSDDKEEMLLRILPIGNQDNMNIHYIKKRNGWDCSAFNPDYLKKVMDILNEENVLEKPYIRMNMIL